MEEEVAEILLPKISRRDSSSEANLELKSYGSGLKWVFLDYSSLWRAGLSWSIFFLLNIGVPLVSHFVFSCSDCDPSHQRPFDAIIQLSLSLFAAISFLSLSSFARKYGLRRFLFLNKLSVESDKVRQGYTHQLHRSMRLLSAFVLPCFLADSAYKIWWFSTGGNQIPYLYNIYLSKAIICILLMCSWLYRISLCFLVCILFRLTCYLHLLRLDEFAQVFERESEVAAILIEHLSIRRNLRVISHRFRLFILSILILVTISQFASLLVITEPRSHVNIATAGELALCSITLVTGLLICLRSAAKITHKAQSVTSLAAKWHACATINSFDELEDETPSAQIASAQGECPVASDWDSDNEEGDGDDVLDNTNLVPIYANTISYQKRQALVTYFEHNRAGITVYGFMLDRTWLHTIFAIQLSLTLWILNKTIGIS
ncbi:extracellular ligand-gated ion channel protein [Perilla frutescens var. hirtella]|uniref:Extracellular ligand-gated ion channel protein n=1 Tax=Perilla frutescens var. hirtella TaxID=608512 RepID=A0AAD4JRF4_PERFH|nr:extracellular ligand-gated ion channel protein [Perilla frutescens var. hirtella]